MSVQELYEEANNPVVGWLGVQARKIQRQVNCAIESTIRTKLDRAFCKGLAQCAPGTVVRHEFGCEFVEYIKGLGFDSE